MTSVCCETTARAFTRIIVYNGHHQTLLGALPCACPCVQYQECPGTEFDSIGHGKGPDQNGAWPNGGVCRKLTPAGRLPHHQRLSFRKCWEYRSEYR